MDTPQFTFSETVRASGVPGGTLQSWLNRQIFGSIKTRTGVHRLLCTATVLQIAFTGELARLGFSPAVASEIALALLADSPSGIAVVLAGPSVKLFASIAETSEYIGRLEQPFALVPIQQIKERVLDALGVNADAGSTH